MKTIPLSSSFMVTAIIGFIISWIYVYPRSPSWGFTFMLFFMIMIIAALISMTNVSLKEGTEKLK